MADVPLIFPNIGNALASGFQGAYAMQQMRHARDENRRIEEARPYVGAAVQGDQAALGKVLANDPKTAAAIIQNLGRLDEQKRKQVGEAANYTAQAANAILQADPKDRPAIYAQMRQQGIDRGYKMDGLPEQYSPQMDAILRGHRAAALPIVEWYKQDQTNQRHNTPAATNTGSFEVLNPGGGVPAAPAPTPMPGRPSASAVPPDVVQNTSVAGGPTGPLGSLNGPAPTAMPAQASGGVTAVPQDFGQGSPGPLPGTVVPPQSQQGAPQGPAPATPQGDIWNVDPSSQGGKMMGVRSKPGGPLMPAEVNGHFIYQLPDGRRVLFKPGQKAERDKPPTGFEWADDGAGGRALSPIKGGPADPDRILRERVPPGFRLAQDGKSLEFIPGGPADPSIARRSAPMNNEQARDAGFADRMTNSNMLLSKIDTQGGSLWQRLTENVPMIGGYAQSPEYQEFRQARDDFINAQLRRESGAAISKDEYIKADKQYFPQPGDSPQVIERKALNRKLAVEGMIRGAGPSYQPSPSVPKEGAAKPGERPPLSSFQR